MEVPSTEWGTGVVDAASQAPLAAEWRKLPGVVEHTFTHFHLVLDVWVAETLHDGVLRDDGDYRWTRREDLAGEALPTVMRKVVAHVIPDEPAPGSGRKPRGRKAGSRLSPG